MTGVSTSTRPQQVTTAAWVVVVSAVLLVASAYDAMAQLRSLDTRASLARSLGSGSGKALGLTVDQATGVLHVVLLVSGAAAATAAVLAVYALRGDRAARLALGAAAVVVLVSSPFSGMFLGSVVALGAALMWSRPARDWFDGRIPEPADERLHQEEQPPPERPQQQPEGEQAPSSAPPSPPTYAPAPQQPPPHAGYGQPPPPPAAPPGQPYGQPTLGQPAYGPPLPGHAPGWGDRAPGQVRMAALITWVLSAMVILLYGLVAIGLVLEPQNVLDAILKRYQSNNFTRSQLQAVLWAVVLIVEAWAVAACVLAFLVVRRKAWARIVLVISAGVSCLVSVLALPVSAVHVIGAAAVMGLLLGPAARVWTATQARPDAYGPGRGGPGSGGDGQGQPPVW